MERESKNNYENGWHTTIWTELSYSFIPLGLTFAFIAASFANRYVQVKTLETAF